MINPWLNISFEDYEKHMSDERVGQTAALSLITKDMLEFYKPESFVVLGCSTGNGFNHINNLITKKVYGVDINPSYLDITKKRFGRTIPGLELICADINTDKIHILNTNLVLAALIFEYINVEVAVKKIYDCLEINGTVVVVIQKNNQNEFVSKTKYTSLLSLQNISSEINESELINLFLKNSFYLSGKNILPLSSGKEFIIIAFKKISLE